MIWTTSNPVILNCIMRKALPVPSARRSAAKTARPTQKRQTNPTSSRALSRQPADASPAIRHSGFVIHSSLGFRHSSFPPSPRPRVSPLRVFFRPLSSVPPLFSFMGHRPLENVIITGWRGRVQDPARILVHLTP